MYNSVPVFQLLLQDNPHLFTTEGLSSLLLDCVHMKSPNRHKFTYPSLLNKQVYLAIAGLEGSAEDEVMIYRIMSDPQAWYNYTKVRQQGQPSENIGEEFYSSFGIEIYLQHRIINSIRCLQKSLNISGVRQTNIAVRDNLSADKCFAIESVSGGIGDLPAGSRSYPINSPIFGKSTLEQGLYGNAKQPTLLSQWWGEQNGPFYRFVGTGVMPELSNCSNVTPQEAVKVSQSIRYLN